MQTAVGRNQNRRVDLILDKRNSRVSEGLKRTHETEKQEKTTHEIDGFEFNLTMPGQEPENLGSGDNRDDAFEPSGGGNG